MNAPDIHQALRHRQAFWAFARTRAKQGADGDWNLYNELKRDYGEELGKDVSPARYASDIQRLARICGV